MFSLVSSSMFFLDIASASAGGGSLSFLGEDNNTDILEDDEAEEEDRLLSNHPKMAVIFSRNYAILWFKRFEQPKSLSMEVVCGCFCLRTHDAESTRDGIISGKEQRSRDVPVTVGGVTANMLKTGEELDDLCSEILSISALCNLPREITLDYSRHHLLLLNSAQTTTSHYHYLPWATRRSY